jgi:hypothetical protein
MKPVVAGLKIENTRDVFIDEVDDSSTVPVVEEDDEESWHSQPAFVPAIRATQKSLSQEDANLIEEQKCFSWLWEDEDGVCPEDGTDTDENGKPNLCHLRASCQAVWNQVQTEKAARAKQKKSKTVDGQLLTAKQKKRALKVERNKWEGKKYQRKGYEDLGRPVDSFVSAFVGALEDPPVLPRIFNSTNFKEKYGKLGACTITQTASYHGVYHKGVLVARLWTNAANAAIIDVVPEMVPALTKASTNGGTEPSGYRWITKPEKATPTTMRKIRPCTHRVKVRSADAAAEVALQLKRKFRWRKKKNPSS